MESYTAIPKGYMTVGELAKKMGTTVRTLQYYDAEGLLAPSAMSDGGRRLYTDKDRIKLHQILSLKALGFSLKDIKTRLIALDTPADVAAALSEQADDIRKKMESLAESLQAIDALRTEVLQMQTVDFKKVADILVNLQMKNEFYWMIKHFDDQTLQYCRTHFDKESGRVMMERFQNLSDEAIRLQKTGVPPESEPGQDFAKAFWDMILDFTGGDLRLLPNLLETGGRPGPDPEWNQQQAAANSYIKQALDVYFTATGYDPLKGDAHELRDTD